MRSGTASGIGVALVVLIAFLATDVHAQWQRVETLEGISVQDFAITAGETLYTSSDREDGLYYSTDAGQNWQRRDDLATLLSLTLETAGEDLYFLAMDLLQPGLPRRLYRLTHPLSPLEVIPSPRGGSIGTFCCSQDGWLYATLDGNPDTDSVYLSTDGGQSWTGVCRNYTPERGKNALRVDTRKRLWSQSSSSLAWYDPATSSWISIGGGRVYNSSRLRVFVQENGDVFINGRMGIVRFDAASQSLQDVYVPATPPRIELEFWPAEDGRLFVAVGNNDYSEPSAWLYESTDGGRTWDTVGVELQLPVSFLGERDGVIYANHAGLLVRTRDHGRTLESCSHGIASKDVWKFGIRGNHIVAQSWRYAISTDAGVQWTTRGINPGGNPQGIQTSLDGTWLEDIGGFRLSRDGGQSWERPWATDPEYTPSDFLVLDNLVILATVTGSIHRSTDNGWSWSLVHESARSVTNLTEAQGVLYGVSGPTLLHSTDRGASWHSSDLPAVDNPVIAGNDRVLLLSASSVLWTSTDRGTTWLPLPLDTLSQGINSFAVNRHGFFAAVRDDPRHNRIRRSVILSTDDGKSWEDITGNLPASFTEKNPLPVPELAFTYADALFVAVRGRGLFRYDNMPVGVPRENVAAQTIDVTLWPTITSSEFQYRVQARNAASVTIYNSAGAEMHHTGISAEGGTQRVDVRRWPAGTYFLRVWDGDGSAIREFVVLR